METFSNFVSFVFLLTVLTRSYDSRSLSLLSIYYVLGTILSILLILFSQLSGMVIPIYW